METHSEQESRLILFYTEALLLPLGHSAVVHQVCERATGHKVHDEADVRLCEDHGPSLHDVHMCLSYTGLENDFVGDKLPQRVRERPSDDFNCLLDTIALALAQKRLTGPSFTQGLHIPFKYIQRYV